MIGKVIVQFHHMLDQFCAWHRGDSDPHHAGWGDTPEAAEKDLARLDQERADAAESENPHADDNH